MSRYYVFNDDLLVALGGNPLLNPAIRGKESMEFRPEKLTDGNWALPEAAVPSMTAAQFQKLDGISPVTVEESQLQWMNESAEMQDDK